MAPTSPATWTERYEAFRRCAQEDPRIFASSPLGLILLVRHGVAGWMRRWAEPLPHPLPSSAVRTQSVSPTPSAWQSQLTALLAQMAVEQLQLNAHP